MKKLESVFSKKILILINLAFLVLIVLLARIVFSKDDLKSRYDIVHDENSYYSLTNPILDCELENGQNDNSIIYTDKINNEIDKLKSQYGVKHVSLYFRDLNNGLWLGINEKEDFSPASLLKVPVLIAFLHQAETDPLLLEKKITILPSDINQIIRPNIISSEDHLIVGNEYTLLEIARRMIQKSDNDAVLVLLRNIKKSYIEDIFKSIGLQFKGTADENLITVKDYAGFFRILFNASYLDREMSELALEILSGSEYKNGIVAGVPKDIVIAHKFGERSINGNADIRLHDCGVVYYPDKPYIICIMTRGDDFRQQEKLISDLSKYVYQAVDNN